MSRYTVEITHEPRSFDGFMFGRWTVMLRRQNGYPVRCRVVYTERGARRIAQKMPVIHEQIEERRRREAGRRAAAPRYSIDV